MTVKSTNNINEGNQFYKFVIAYTLSQGNLSYSKTIRQKYSIQVVGSQDYDNSFTALYRGICGPANPSAG
jgi:hypothetical protein